MNDKRNNDWLKNLVQTCMAGNYEARVKFQQLFGEIIYNFPILVHKEGIEQTGDFYLYVFEKDRIFKRLKTFKGERITIESYLTKFVLRDLFREWCRKKMSTEINTFSISDEFTENNASLAQAEMMGQSKKINTETPEIHHLYHDKRYLVLRILYLFEFPLVADDIRSIANNTGKTIREVLIKIEAIEGKLFLKAEQQQQMSDKLSPLYSRRMEYQRKLVDIQKKIADAKHTGDELSLTDLSAMKEELERKYSWRLKQVQQTLEQNPHALITVPYKDIGDLLQTTTGSISSKIHKAKKAFQKEARSL